LDKAFETNLHIDLNHISKENSHLCSTVEHTKNLIRQNVTVSEEHHKSIKTKPINQYPKITQMGFQNPEITRKNHKLKPINHYSKNHTNSQIETHK
jgi:hypothetical protein